MIFRTALLILNNTNNLYKAFSLIQNDVENILYVQFLPGNVSTMFFTDRYLSSKNKLFYKNLVSDGYKNTNTDNNLDVRILLSNFKSTRFSKIYTRYAIDVVYFEYNFNQSEISQFCSMFVENKSDLCTYISLPCDKRLPEEKELEYTDDLTITEWKESDNVVLGGTFDKLHHGHKILLSEAILRCRKKLTIGVCDNSILKSKILSELIDSCEDRILYVKNLLEDLDQNLIFEVVPIYDMYGPTKEDPSFEMLIASADTLNGALKVNEKRKQTGLNELEIVLVDLLNSSENDNDVFEEKVSSSSRRIRMLGTLLSSPRPNSNLRKPPYIIGLTGGIASGKTAIVDYLTELGAKCVIADRLGHDIFESDDAVRSELKQTFGMSIFNESGQVNRQKLGSIVFNDEKKLNDLNQLLWPAILRLVQVEIRRLFQEENCNVIILEAAVLVQANWQVYCHEIWTSIIPKNEAISRLQIRNNYSVDEALARISKQPTNEEYVKHSNVIFCTIWDKSFTKIQVCRAWADLQLRL